MSGLIKNWNTKKLKKRILDRLEQNAEVTGIFLQNSARARLYAVQYPEWGQRYRRKVLARMIVHEIERRPNEVVLTLGVLTNPLLVGYTKIPGDARYFGFYIEVGSRKFPAHPYLRPAIFNNGRKVVTMMTDGIGE